MDKFYRIRAYVDGAAEERVIRATSPESAMNQFKAIEEDGVLFEEYGIFVAMVHAITFNEAGPVFEDVSYQLSNVWARADFESCLKFLSAENAKSGKDDVARDPFPAVLTTNEQRLFELACELDDYLRQIRAENLDGSEPALGDLLNESLRIRLDIQRAFALG